MIRPINFSAVDAPLKMPHLSTGDFIRQWAESVAMLALDKEVADLTKEEKFSIAFLAGVPLAKNFRLQDSDSFKMSMTTVPCSICKIDGRFHVAYKPDSK